MKEYGREKGGVEGVGGNMPVEIHQPVQGDQEQSYARSDLGKAEGRPLGVCALILNHWRE